MLILAHALTDFQRAWESEGVLGLFLSVYDWAYRWLRGLTDPAAAAGPVLRVRVTRYRGRPFTLSDATEISPGDLIGEFHLDNERVASLHDDGGRSPWTGLAFRRVFHASLEALALQALGSPRYAGVHAVTATTIFHQGTQRMGFDIRPLSRPFLGRLIAAYERRLLAQFHPLGSRRGGRPRFGDARQIWISRTELIRRYASERSSVRETHA